MQHLDVVPRSPSAVIHPGAHSVGAAGLPGPASRVTSLLD
eukprot:CAMPEP_0203961996 /NCGR_PEP_ID=MMETSP0359-20131031/92302_1 /ASSEMBLY_ACC=CAM_ASM_000338 /TAXON_ID=268821 /ORGANISM="Scrippsiella Hangoei, Strain SHTV-5" /LENGTH=39 /DNA_ID= /DNA_START= /DNA_END= /DNA_ORIENTATION=